MTSAPADLLAFRLQALGITGLAGNDLGIAPDPKHLSSGGYHVGVEDIQHIGRWNTDYSTRQSRDRIDGTNSSSAVDVGSAWRNGGRAAWLRFNGLLYAEMRDHADRLPALRAINVSLDGRTKRRYDQMHRDQGLIASADTVDTHTHMSFWRDTEGRRAATLDRIVQLMRAAAAGAPTPEFATTGDDNMGSTWTEPLTQGSPGFAGQQRDTALAFAYQFSYEAREGVGKLIAAAQADEVRDKANTAAIEALATALKAGGGNVDVAAVIAAINAVRDEARAKFAELAAKAAEQAAAADSHIADLQEQLARAVAAAEANLSPAERATLPK